MKKIKVISLFILTMLILNSTSLTAQPRQGNFGKQGKRSGNCLKGCCQSIPGLSDEQQDQIKTLRTDHWKETKSLKNEIREKKAKLRTLRTSDDVDMDEIYELIEDISSLKMNVAKKREAHRQDVRELLTDEQKMLFDERGPRFTGPNHRGPKGKKGRRF